MIPSVIRKEHLLQAIQEMKREGVPPLRHSRDYCLVYESHHYPPKYIIALAHEIATGRFLSSDEFSGGQKSNNFLESRGFQVVECDCGRTVTASGRSTRNVGRPSSKAHPSQLTTHSERCPECKLRVRQLLESIYGTCHSNYSFPWSARTWAYKGTPLFETLQRVFGALEAYRGHSDFIRSEQLPPCDFFVPGPGFLVEFDESQHFTAPRKVALSLYPPDSLIVGFSIGRWISLCDAHDAKDNDPPYRDEQRAWYDTLRDLVPSLHGLEPTVRIYAGDFPWCSLNAQNDNDVKKFKALLEGAQNPSSVSGAVSVYTVTLEQPDDRHTDKLRLQMLAQLLRSISERDSRPHLILLPSGYLGTGTDSRKNVNMNLATLQDQVAYTIRQLGNRTWLCLGVDGEDGKDQLAVAVSGGGIEAIGRKFCPAGGDDNLKPAPDYVSHEDKFQRIFTFGGKRWYLAVCNDVFDISRLKLPNPGVDVILNTVHQFWPRGSNIPAKGDNYFARLGFAGASKAWGCPVFGTAVFFQKLVPKRWPTAVLWKSGDSLPRQCRYKDNQLWPQDEFSISFGAARALIRRFAIA